MKLTTQLLTVTKNKDKEGFLTFGCSLRDLQQVEVFVDDITVKVIIGDDDTTKFVGQVTGTSTSAGSADAKSKFKIKCPSSENFKTSELSTLCGEEVELTIEADV